jgi:predicted signal transduction protein with EAL and GGDEF domain
VAAEGVEAAFGWDALGRLGCDFVQGYFVSKPLAAADFIAWIAKRHGDPPASGAPRPPAVAPMALIPDLRAYRRSGSGTP